MVGLFRVRLVRVLSADANPKGAGVRFGDLSCYLDETHEGRRHLIRPGSYADAPAPSLCLSGALTWTALLRARYCIQREPSVACPTRSLRADMVYFKTRAGGAVFSAGSITFCGSLWRNGFEGPISRLLENVLRDFTRGDRPTGADGHQRTATG